MLLSLMINRPHFSLCFLALVPGERFQTVWITSWKTLAIVNHKMTSPEKHEHSEEGFKKPTRTHRHI
jgi:hypothetical protein